MLASSNLPASGNASSCLRFFYYGLHFQRSRLHNLSYCLITGKENVDGGSGLFGYFRALLVLWCGWFFFFSILCLLLELRFWLSRSRWFWRGRRLLWLELADMTMGDMQDAKCDLSTLNLSRGR